MSTSARAGTDRLHNTRTDRIVQQNWNFPDSVSDETSDATKCPPLDADARVVVDHSGTDGWTTRSGKPLSMIGDKPMIVHVMERAREAWYGGDKSGRVIVAVMIRPSPMR